MRHWQHSGCVMATPHLGASSSVRLVWHSWVRRHPGAEPAHAQTVAGNTVPVAESTLRAITDSEGPRIVAFGLDRPGGDPTYKCVRSACAPSHLLGDIVTSQPPSDVAIFHTAISISTVTVTQRRQSRSPPTPLSPRWRSGSSSSRRSWKRSSRQGPLTPLMVNQHTAIAPPSL